MTNITDALPIISILIAMASPLYAHFAINQSQNEHKIAYIEKRLELLYYPLQYSLESYKDLFINTNEKSVSKGIIGALYLKENDDSQQEIKLPDKNLIAKSDDNKHNLESIIQYQYLATPYLEKKFDIIHTLLNKNTDPKDFKIENKFIDTLNNRCETVENDIKLLKDEHDKLISQRGTFTSIITSFNRTKY